jgi:hypothetical protein
VVVVRSGRFSEVALGEACGKKIIHERKHVLNITTNTNILLVSLPQTLDYLLQPPPPPDIAQCFVSNTPPLLSTYAT